MEQCLIFDKRYKRDGNVILMKEVCIEAIKGLSPLPPPPHTHTHMHEGENDILVFIGSGEINIKMND